MKKQLSVASCQLMDFKVWEAGVGKQESGSRNQETGNQKTEIFKRVRWRCRRGLLELDIVLGRFIEAQYAGLSDAEKLIFEAFLDMPDNPLWDMVSGRLEAASGEQQALLEKIRTA